MFIQNLLLEMALNQREHILQIIFNKIQVSKSTSDCELTQSCVVVQIHCIKLLYLLMKQIPFETWCFLCYFFPPYYRDFYYLYNSLLLVILLKVIPYLLNGEIYHLIF